ncbi:hypothetical protein MCEKE4_00290 [Acidimicrobiia bacterium]
MADSNEEPTWILARDLRVGDHFDFDGNKFDALKVEWDGELIRVESRNGISSTFTPTTPFRLLWEALPDPLQEVGPQENQRQSMEEIRLRMSELDRGVYETDQEWRRLNRQLSEMRRFEVRVTPPIVGAHGIDSSKEADQVDAEARTTFLTAHLAKALELKKTASSAKEPADPTKEGKPEDSQLKSKPSASTSDPIAQSQMRRAQAEDVGSGSDLNQKSALVNAVSFIAVPVLGLLPLFTAGALGFSFSVDAFEPEEKGQTFWLTVVPVGWVMVAISVVAFAVIAMTLMKSSRSAKRIENQVLAGLGFIASALLVASWYFANKQIDDGKREASSQLVDEGNLFAGIPGLGVSFGPAFGFWLMLAVALAIAGYNVFLIREAGKPTSSVAVTANTTLADGIRELSELRDQGMISDEEFVLAKRKLLGE